MSWKIKGEYTKDENVVKEHFGLSFAPITKSLLDTDLYKFSMGKTYHSQFGNVETVWDFKARNVGEGKDLKPYTEKDVEEIKKQLKAYCALRFDPDELVYLSSSSPWITRDYTHYLKKWHPEFDNITITGDPVTGIHIEFGGFQDDIEYYEIPVLEICAEVYYRNHFEYEKLLKEYKEKTLAKILEMKAKNPDGTMKYHFGAWSEFGARRRLSFEAQDWLISVLAAEKKADVINADGTHSNPAFAGFIGTSNVYLAKKYGVKPVGTCAHEFIETVGQGNPAFNPAYSNKFAMEAWVKEYKTANGIWLTDTIGDELCRRDMTVDYATLFSGVRNDSGDPFVWGDNWIKHYESLKINPKTKTLLFSNAISSLELWDKLCRYFEDRAIPAFGIGTYWSGPQTITPLNIVAKVVLVNGMDVAKLSDDSGKTMSRSPEYVHYLKRTLDWRLQSGK